VYKLNIYFNLLIQIITQIFIGNNKEIYYHHLGYRSKWCPDCNNKAKLNPKQFLATLEQREGKLIGEYKHSTIPVEVECKSGHRWYPRPFYIVIGNWCPTCNRSNCEQIVALYLNNKNILYKTQATIPGLPRRRYDFIFELKGTKVIIEYDGEIHFKFIKYYRRIVDKVKTYHALMVINLYD